MVNSVVHTFRPCPSVGQRSQHPFGNHPEHAYGTCHVATRARWKKTKNKKHTRWRRQFFSPHEPQLPTPTRRNHPYETRLTRRPAFSFCSLFLMVFCSGGFVERDVVGGRRATRFRLYSGQSTGPAATGRMSPSEPSRPGLVRRSANSDTSERHHRGTARHTKTPTSDTELHRRSEPASSPAISARTRQHEKLISNNGLTHLPETLFNPGQINTEQKARPTAVLKTQSSRYHVVFRRTTLRTTQPGSPPPEKQGEQQAHYASCLFFNLARENKTPPRVRPNGKKKKR